MNKKSKLTFGTLFAVGLAYVAGILTAPKSGKETRKEIHDKASEKKAALQHKLEVIGDDLGNLINRGKSKLDDVESHAKSDLSRAVDAAVAAKDKSRDILSAVRSGDANDKDLKNALKDANKAIDNLKKFIDKNV